jgi:unsaturated rhamnogalacturonyl hydrolase
MNRRKFFKKSLIPGLLAASATGLVCQKSTQSESSDTILIDKVKRAMLSMQRASWEQGIAAQAFLEAGDDTMVYLMAKEAVLRQTEEGRLSVVYTDNGVTDPAASGEAVLYAAKKWNDPELTQAADHMLSYLLEKAPRTKIGVISHTLNAKEIWIDSLYMAPPFIAACGKYKEALKQIEGIHKILWNPDKKLYSHRWSDDQKKFINEKFWGVGNGWALAGMCRVITLLPSSMKQEKEKLIHYLKETLDSCLRFVRADYLFHNDIDDTSTFIETNLSQMVAYTIFRGISEKWLEKRYLETALKMRKAVHKKVDAHGFVQGVCGAPFFNKPGRATEGQAFFILMEAAIKKIKFQ